MQTLVSLLTITYRHLAAGILATLPLSSLVEDVGQILRKGGRVLGSQKPPNWTIFEDSPKGGRESFSIQKSLQIFLLQDYSRAGG